MARRLDFDDAPTSAWTARDALRDHPRPITYEDTEQDCFDEADNTEVTQAEDFEMFAPAECEARIGSVIGAYDVVRVLAQGGMGTVYLGRHRRLGRKVAIKLPHPQVARDPDLSRRFMGEALAAIEINHPGVVNVLDYGLADDGVPYLVMELLEGSSLADKLGHGPLPTDVAIKIAARVADTVAAAHEAGVIHRDLKPENVFLQRQRHRPDRVTIKVLDFGFAKLVGTASGLAGGLSPQTEQGMILGTPCYMSPEQCLATAPQGPRSDIYALGCILYEMVADQLPFNGTLSEVQLALRYRPPVAPRWHNRALPAELDGLIMEMLSKDPAGRPDSMVVVARRLEGLLARRALLRRAAGTPAPER